jgi:hypothetical protein
MEYYITYKGKQFGPPMTKEEAEMKLIVLSKSFDGLEVTPVNDHPPSIDSISLLGQIELDAPSSDRSLSPDSDEDNK